MNTNVTGFQLLSSLYKFFLIDIFLIEILPWPVKWLEIVTPNWYSWKALSKHFQMNTNVAGFQWLSSFLHIFLKKKVTKGGGERVRDRVPNPQVHFVMLVTSAAVICDGCIRCVYWDDLLIPVITQRFRELMKLTIFKFWWISCE